LGFVAPAGNACKDFWQCFRCLCVYRGAVSDISRW